jgi:hypothetical protein
MFAAQHLQFLIETNLKQTREGNQHFNHSAVRVGMQRLQARPTCMPTTVLYLPLYPARMLASPSSDTLNNGTCNHQHTSAAVHATSLPA